MGTNRLFSRNSLIAMFLVVAALAPVPAFCGPRIVVLSDLHIGRNNHDFELLQLQKLVDELLARYREKGEARPLIIISGDTVDHFSTADNYRWYEKTSIELKRLLDHGFHIITTMGNHDASPLERYDRIANVTHVATPFNESILGTIYDKDKAQRDFNNALKANATKHENDATKISGLSVHPSSFQAYEKWKTQMREYSTNFVSDPSYTLQTRWSINPQALSELKSLVVAGRDIPADLVRNLISYDRGYQVLSVSSVDKSWQIVATGFRLSESAFTFLVQPDATGGSPHRFYSTDGRLRFDSGLVDGDEIARIFATKDRFKKEDEALREKLESQIRNELSAASPQGTLPEDVIEHIARNLPPVPRMARIVFAHHSVDYHPVGYRLSTQQKFIKHVVDSIGGSRAIDPKLAVETAARLGLVPLRSIQLIHQRAVGSSEGNLLERARYYADAVFRYGQIEENIDYGLRRYDGIVAQYGEVHDAYRVAGDGFESDTYNEIIRIGDVILGGSHRDGGFNASALKNALPAGDAVGNGMSGFLDAIREFDVLVSGHRHRLNINNIKSAKIHDETLKKDVESVNSQLSKLRTDRTGIAWDTARAKIESLILPYAGDDAEYKSVKAEILARLFLVYLGDYLQEQSFADVKASLLHWVVESPNSTKFHIGDKKFRMWIELELDNTRDLLDYSIYRSDTSD